jgi:hypothetical protein
MKKVIAHSEEIDEINLKFEVGTNQTFELTPDFGL